eukprot:c24114_g1_i1 orf=2-6367(-)
MENYGNDLFLSQEGCPSLDFTLLDRPSSSTVPAPGSTAPLFPGDNSFPSFDFFDGAGVESFGDRSIPGHRSYISEVRKDAMRRTTPTHPGPVQRQRQGVHDFFGQDNQQQQQHSGSADTWPGVGSGGSYMQSQYFLPGVGNAEDLSSGNISTSDTFAVSTHSSHSGMPSGETGLPFSSMHASKPLAGGFVDGRRFPKEAMSSSVVASQTRNQLGSAQQNPSDAQNTSSKFGNSLPINSGMLEHQSSANDMANPNVLSQNQYGRYSSQSLSGIVTNEAPSTDFFANKLSWKGSAQVVHESQPEGPTRSGGMTELQLLRQQALQSKQQQALLSKQQQAMRLQQQEAMRLQQQQQQEAMRVQQQEVMLLQQQEATRMTQQEETRMAQQERMIQQDVMKQRTQEAIRTQQQEVMRTQQQEVLRSQQQEATMMTQQEAMRMTKQEVIRTQNHEVMRMQQQEVMRSQQQEVMRSQQQDAMRSQQHEAMQFQRQQALWSRHQLAAWSRQEPVLESEQKHALQPQPQQGWQSQSQQQHALQSQQQQALPFHQQQDLQSQQQQALQSQQQQQALRSQQEHILRSQQQKALRAQQQQPLQFQQQQAFQSQQQQTPLPQQQQTPLSQQHLALQSQHQQLQEFLVAQQLNQQLEHSKPQHMSQETCTEFTGTSYSALLHGPDTPPSQSQMGGENTLSEPDNQTAAFTSASTQNFVWPIDGSSYYQGLSSDPTIGQNLMSSHNSLSGSFPSESALHLHNDANIARSQNSGMQNMLPEYQSGGHIAPSARNAVFQADKTGNEDVRIGGCGLINDSSNELRNKHQMHAKPLVQSSQYLAGQPARQNGLGNGPYQINLLSQSQQHFQEVQLSQQRNWESLEQKQGASKPSFSEAFHSLSQSVSTPERSTSQSGIEQNLSGFGTRSRISRLDSYQSGTSHINNGAGFKQHQMFTTAEVPKRLNMDGDDYSNTNAWSAMQSHQIGQDAGLYLQQIPDAKHDTWGNKGAPLASHRVRNSFSLVGPSESTQVVLSNVQSTSVDMRVPPTKMVASSSLSNQENFNLTLENGWKENDRAAVSKQTTSALSEPDGYPQGLWKRHTSLQESVGGLDTTCEPLNRFETGSIWNRKVQQEKVVLEAPFNMQAASSIPNIAIGPDDTGQQTHETPFLGWEGASQQTQEHFSPIQVGTQHTANSVKAFSQGTTTMVFNNNENGQFYSFKKSVEPQGSLVDKQRVPQQPMDPSTMNVSLAHLRHSQPSSPMSPQHVKLGLGPSNLPQNIQQAGNASMRTSSQIDGLVRKGSTSSLEGKMFLAALPNDASGTLGNKGDLNQGFAASLNGMLLQNNARPSSALSNSSSFSKESAESEALPPSSFPSALGVEGPGVSQGHSKPGGNSLGGVQHLQMNAGGSFEEEHVSSLHEKPTSISEYSRQPLHNAGNSQEKLPGGARKANNDPGSLRVFQNQQIINMALKQLGNRAQAANLAGLLTTLKTSLSERSNNSGNREKFFPGIVESGRLPCSGAQEDGRAEGSATQLMQRPQVTSREPTNPGLVREDCSPPKFVAGIQTGSNESNHHLTFNQEKTSTFEASGSATTSLLSDLQRQRIQSVSLMNGSRLRMLQSGGQCEGETGLKTLSSGPSQTDTQMRGSETPSAFSGHGQSVQQQRNMVLEGSPFHQTFKEPTPNAAWAARLPKSAIEAVGKSNEALLKPLEHRYLGKVALGQEDAYAPTAKMKFTESKEIRQQNASVSQYVNQRNLQVVNSSPPGHVQLPKQVAKGVVNPVSSPCTDKSVDLVSVSDVEALHKSRLRSGNSNDELPPSQDQKHDSFSYHSNPVTPLQNSLVNKHAQPVANDVRDTHLSIGKEDPVSRAEEVRPGLKGHIATSNQLPQHQVSSSNPSSHGIVAVHPKKRKKPVPLLIPWHMAATQPRNSLPSTSDVELTWANAANRLPYKDGGDVLKDNAPSSSRAKRRLRFTTQLMQQLIPPLSSRLMHGNTLVDNECATFSLAKDALEDACRLVNSTKREAGSAQDTSEKKNMPLRGLQAGTWSMARGVETFMERGKALDSELARVDSSTSASELGSKVYELERMEIVNRLAGHHGTGFASDSSEICLVESSPDVGAGIWKPSPKKYVTAAPMPRTLPGVKC